MLASFVALTHTGSFRCSQECWSLGRKGKSLMDSFQLRKPPAGPNKACYKEELLHVLLAVNLAWLRGQRYGTTEGGGYSFWWKARQEAVCQLLLPVHPGNCSGLQHESTGSVDNTLMPCCGISATIKVIKRWGKTGVGCSAGPLSAYD